MTRRSVSAQIRTRKFRTKAHDEDEDALQDMATPGGSSAADLKRGRILRRTEKQFLWLEKVP